MKSFPFDSKILQGKDGDTQYDRAIDSKTLREYFHLLYSNGVFAGDNYECFNVVMDETSVTSLDQTTSDSFRVIVKPGACNIEGALGIEEKETVITIDPVYEDKERVDSIVLRLDTNIDARKISIEYKKGTPAVGVPDKDNPNTVLMPALITTRPELTRNSTVYELRLADIMLQSRENLRYKNKIRDLIQDTRWLTDECGVVLCNPKQINTDDISKEIKKLYKDALNGFNADFREAIDLGKDELLSTADDVRDLLKKDEAGKITLELANYVKELKEYVSTSDELEERIEKLKNSSETLQKTTLPAINSNIDKLKKTVDEDIQNTLHSNGTSINSLGDRIGTLVNRVSTLEDKIREGFFFNKRLKTFRLYVGNNTSWTQPLHLHVKKDGSHQTVKLMKALEEEWRDKYRPKLLYDKDNDYDSTERGFRWGGAGCYLAIDSKYFRREIGKEEDSPDFCLKRGKTKGLLLVMFCIDKYSDYPYSSFQNVVQFCANGSTYYAYEYSVNTYYWTIPINDSDPDQIDLDFNFDWFVSTSRSDYDVSIEFDFTLTYIYC